MSRVGKLPITVPEGVSVEVKNNVVKVEGSKGSLEQEFVPQISVKVEDNQVIVERKDETKKAKSYHGLYRQLIQNMITGVTKGFQKVLLVNGVGYRAEVKDDILHLNLGFSTPIEYVIPEGISVSVEGQNKILINGVDKQKVGQASTEIRSLRPPEPYKGKGVKFEDEQITRKIGKSGVK